MESLEKLLCRKDTTSCHKTYRNVCEFCSRTWNKWIFGRGDDTNMKLHSYIFLITIKTAKQDTDFPSYFPSFLPFSLPSFLLSNWYGISFGIPTLAKYYVILNMWYRIYKHNKGSRKRQISDASMKNKSSWVRIIPSVLQVALLNIKFHKWEAWLVLTS